METPQEQLVKDIRTLATDCEKIGTEDMIRITDMLSALGLNRIAAILCQAMAITCMVRHIDNQPNQDLNRN